MRGVSEDALHDVLSIQVFAGQLPMLAWVGPSFPKSMGRVSGFQGAGLWSPFVGVILTLIFDSQISRMCVSTSMDTVGCMCLWIRSGPVPDTTLQIHRFGS